MKTEKLCKKVQNPEDREQEKCIETLLEHVIQKGDVGMTQVIVQPATAVNVKQLLQTAITHELRLLKIGIERTQERLHHFEQKFHKDTSTFYQAFQRGEAGDDMEYIKWAGEYETFRQLQQDYHELQEMQLC